MALDDRYANKFAPLDSTAIYPKSGHALLYTTFDRWNEMPYKSYLCLAHSISSSQMLMPHKHQSPSSLLIIIMSQHLAWSSLNDMIHSISSHDLFGPSILTFLALHRRLGLSRSSPSPRSIGAKSCPNFTASRSVASKPWLALHYCNQSIEPSLILIFSTLVIWLHVMAHMQWVPPSHYMSIASTLSHFSSMAHVAHTSVFVWTNHLCIST